MPTLAPSTIADVITEAVLSAFRERHGNMESAANAVAHAAAAAAVSVATNTAATATTAAAAAANNNNNNNNNDMETTPTPTPASASIPVRTFAMPHIPMTFPRNVQQELPAQASVQNPPVSPQTTLSTGEASEESFFRYVRLPAMFAAMPEGDNAEQRREITMPMFIVGYRVRAAADDRHQHSHSPGQEERNMVLETDTRRRSPRLAERDDRRGRQQQQSDEDQQHNHTVASRWVVYILSGVGDGGLTGLSDSPTYEELLALAESIGYARNPISIDQINASAPIQRYTAQVGGSMIGNIEKCLVCLEAFEEMESVRVLKCHHGFHQDCIDKWLTEGQNRCPLCRVAPVERHSQQHEEAH
ncbi:hypothetical protein BX666DRAFT_1876340 [Dichotomocladium elegans]|nr:hypothetical protein BX666DRAFT_1876340 [Dichotomocladium elegans]